MEGIGPGSIELFLNRDFVVEAASVDGQNAHFSWGDPDHKLPYVTVARALNVVPSAACVGACKVRLRYAGRLPDVVAEVNMVRPHLVELAAYAAYYPVPPNIGRFPFTGRFTMPDSFTVVSRGERLQAATDHGWRTEIWRASIPGVDIPTVASDELHTRSVREGDVEVSVFFRDLEPRLAEDALREAAASLKYLTHEFGSTPATALRLVFSPREGWGYSRTGLIVVSEQRHLRRSAEEASGGPPDQNVHGNAHEISHFWWHVASTQSSDDWINEALAEYSAVVDSRRRGGASTYRSWAARYLDSLRSKAPPVGIVQTRADSTFRYVNWYERGALFFMCLEARYGHDVLHRALAEILHLGRARAVTTADLHASLARAGIGESWVRAWLEEPGMAQPEACVPGL